MARAARVASKSKGQKRGRPVSASSNDELFDRLGSPTSFPRNKKIYKPGELAEYLYRVEAGCVRTYSEFNGSRRHIHAFYYPGDYFGLEASEQHNIAAETVMPSSIFRVKRTALAAQAARDNGIVQFLLRIGALELQRTQNHSLRLLNSAQMRIVDFLREMTARKPSASEIDLPMPRSDVADYLGLTTESVSRALTQLKKVSAISMSTSRRITMRDALPI
jgi:CRP/FNR family transcriptional regulator, nitrogen fixation regulation protein